MNPPVPQGLNQIHKISRVMIYFMVTFLPPEGDWTLHPSCLPLALPLIFSPIPILWVTKSSQNTAEGAAGEQRWV